MEIIEIKQSEALQAQTASEINQQIATAKQYPRDLQAVLNKIATYATMDNETAADCFYVLRRNGQNGGQVIEGLSVRMAEIIANCWGNMRVCTRIVGNDGRTITAQGICHDLETNVAVSVEVKRRITDRQGRTFSEDMQVVTGNAASAIAFRNAVLKVVPKVVTKRIIEDVKQVAIGKALDLETSRANVVAYFAKLGVTTDQLLGYLGITKVEEIDKEMVYELRATANAIKEGTTSVEETFVKPALEKELAIKAQEMAEKARKKAEQSLSKKTKENGGDGKNKENNNSKPE